MSSLGTPEHLRAASALRDALATYRASEDLISIGAYQPGANVGLDQAVALMPQINAFLRQEARETTTLDDAIEALVTILGGAGLAGAATSKAA